MTKEARNKLIQIRVSPTENALAEKLASDERITLSDLVRKRIFRETAKLDIPRSIQFLNRSNKTLAQSDQYLAVNSQQSKNSQQSESYNLIQQLREELMEAHTLIASGCQSVSIKKV